MVAQTKVSWLFSNEYRYARVRTIPSIFHNIPFPFNSFIPNAFDKILSEKEKFHRWPSEPNQIVDCGPHEWSDVMNINYHGIPNEVISHAFSVTIWWTDKSKELNQ